MPSKRSVLHAAHSHALALAAVVPVASASILILRITAAIFVHIPGCLLPAPRYKAVILRCMPEPYNTVSKI